MYKTFSKIYIIPPLDLILDYIVLNYCLFDTSCFTYAEDHFISHQLAWQKADYPKHHCITELMSWKKCVNIYCEEKTEAGLYGRIAVKKPLVRKQNYVRRL